MANYQHSNSARFPLTTMIPKLEDWLETSLGEDILKKEQALIDKKIHSLFGYHLLQLSISRQHDLAKQSAIRHRFSMCPVDEFNQQVGAIADPDNLPLETDSTDVVILHHVLEYSQFPHQLLREAARITVPHGHLVIIGFNPWSLLGAWSAMSGRLSSSSIWQNRLISMKRMYDWLSLLDLDLMSVDYCFYHSPHPRILQKLSSFERLGQRYRLPFGGSYVLVAKKEMATLTPHRPRWLRAPSFVAGLEPSIYSHKIPKKTTIH